jgi:hypothetical protein
VMLARSASSTDRSRNQGSAGSFSRNYFAPSLTVAKTESS